jgi:phosphonoacetaldehyde hydrolase
MLPRRKITTVILDLSGTTIDGLVRAPTFAFINVFKKHGVALTTNEARHPMGLNKDQHMSQILQIPSVAEKWKVTHGRQPDLVKDTKMLFNDFLPMQLKILSDQKFIKPLPGVMKTLQQLKDMGIKIGLTSGFNMEMTQTILDNSKDIKLASYFDAIIPANHTNIKRGRPYPDAVWENMQQMGTENTFECIKVDDTQAGIMEGNAAGVWTLGLSKYNNFVGMHIDSMEDLESLEKNTKRQSEYHQLIKNSSEHLLEKDPSYVRESLVDLPEVINQLNQELLIDGANQFRMPRNQRQR